MKNTIRFSVVVVLTFLMGCATSSKAVYVKLNPKILTFGTGVGYQGSGIRGKKKKKKVRRLEE